MDQAYLVAWALDPPSSTMGVIIQMTLPVGVSPKSLVTGAYVATDFVTADALAIYIYIILGCKVVVDSTSSHTRDDQSHFNRVLSANTYTSNLRVGKNLF